MPISALSFSRSGSALTNTLSMRSRGTVRRMTGRRMPPQFHVAPSLKLFSARMTSRFTAPGTMRLVMSNPKEVNPKSWLPRCSPFSQTSASA